MSCVPTAPTQNPHNWTGIVKWLEKSHTWSKFVISVIPAFNWIVAMCHVKVILLI